jgi:predicted AAA+ superfamily ATPase
MSSKTFYERPQAAALAARLNEPRRFIQVVAGPRQVGKSTLVQQATQTLAVPVRYASADEPTLRGTDWIAQQWEAARLSIADDSGAVLALDEIQKIPAWSETVKRLWDEDTRARRPLKVVLLGSAPLLIAQGLTESLAGRFETIILPHWSFAEMRAAFGWSCDQFIFYGGYPGAAPLIGEPERWAHYIIDSLIETSISRDVLLLTRVDKPALLRRLFELACRYSGQILSYTKMLGQLQDAGNSTTLAHYLQLLAGAGMVLRWRIFCCSRFSIG